LHRHIAFDLVLSRFSRLLIDPNRGLDDPTLIMQIADGLVVPGNVGLSAEEIAARLDRFYRPYHAAIDRAVEAGIAAGKPPVILSVHSFTQAWKGVPRPWSAAVLWDKDPRLPLPLLKALHTIPGAEIGDNVPYSGQLKGDTLYRHATLRGLAHALVEVRQDLILAEEGQAEWGAHLARVLNDVLRAAPSLHTIEHHGSNTAPAAERITTMDETTRIEIEAAAFRRLVEHLRERTDVQNIDLMNLAGFCRNCLSTWYLEAADERGVPLTKDAAREIVYGMPYEDWKAKYQTEQS
jgi:predicted N-formylglutamate amidohydrolase